jgi:hypothetical protein
MKSREVYTIMLMIDIAGEDKDLKEYVTERTNKCRQDPKPVCSMCRIHCYRPDMRERIRKVMRYAAPRMLFLHPVLTFWHLVHAIKSRRH